MSVHDTITIATELGFTPLNLVLLAMLYFLGAQHGFFPKWWGDKVEKTNQSEPGTKEQMEYLINYYNHDTTAILKSMDAKLGDIKPTLESVELLLKELHVKQNEWEKYGVPARIKKD